MSNDDLNAAHLNRAAISALIGLSMDWREDLANLLRSEAEISRIVRDLLAEAIERASPLGVEINMKNHDATAKRLEGLRIRRRWLEDGRKVAEIKKPKLQQFLSASEIIGKSEGYCKDCYYYFDNFMKWYNNEIKMSDKSFDLEFLESTWHLASFDQNTKSPTPDKVIDIVELKLARIAYLKEYFRDMKGGGRDRAVDVVMALSEIQPPNRT